MLKDGSQFRVIESIIVSSALPKRRASPRVFPWRFELIGPGARKLFEGALDDPTVVRGEFRNPNDRRRIDGITLHRSGAVHFVIRVPLGSAGRLDFFEIKPAYVRAGVLPKNAYQKLGSAEFGGKP